MADENLMSQDDIERLLTQGQAAPPSAASPPAAPAAAEDPGPPVSQNDIDALLSGGTASPQQTEGSPADASKPAAAPVLPPGEGDDDKLLGQEDIEKLLSQARGGAAAPAAAQVAKKEPPPTPVPAEGTMAQKDIEYLLNQAERALESIGTAARDELPHGVAAFRFEEFAGAPASTENATLDLIRDVELDLKIELGRTHMYLEDVLRLRKGSVVPLDKLAGDPVDIFVNGRLIARGEVLVLNDNFCVRVAELISGTNVFD